MFYYWVSFYLPAKQYGPANYPHDPAIIGWWRGSLLPQGWTMCVMLQAEDYNSAKAAILKEWPKAEHNWRFFLKRESPELSERFPEGKHRIKD